MMIRDTLLRIIGAEPRRTVIDYVVPGTSYFFAGLVVGGVTALLLAPKSGREMRHDLKDGADNLRKQIEHRAENVMDKAKGLLPSVATNHDESWESDKTRARRTATNPS